ncbi:acyltransferase [Roseobacter sp. CCS2]|uniref:acyltransferase n=1 Tax=Roseobacter sp. CCS2 TaxID=391593 RepID=UPI0000F3E2CF|nr:acyltransferase [Roseobacter sp. CCS2]EBA12397.1 acetyltransferase, putative [Roseobacter sp. CCS2]
MFKLGFWGLRGLAALRRRVGTWFATRLHRASLAHVGAGTRFQAGVRFDRPKTVEIGANCYFWHGVGASAEGNCASLKIGDRVQVNRFAHLDTVGSLTLADDVLVSEFAVISTHDHGHDPHAPPHPVPKIIGRGAWIGMRAMILPSCCEIGAYAVIGAGAIVTRDVPAGAIVAGNPARVIGHRDDCEAAA